jgi:uroporphyrinogen-III decarboxylase
MNSRERVLAAFAHEEPDRVPCWCGASSEFWNNAKAKLNLDDEGLKLRFRDDFRSVAPRWLPPTYDAVASGGSLPSMFGIHRSGLGCGLPDSHPLAGATLSQVHDYAWPDPAHIQVSHLREQALKYQGQYAMMTGPWSRFFHDTADLVGMEQLYYLMYDQPEIVDAIMGHVTDFYVQMATKSFDALAGAADIWFMGNDLGTSNGPMLGVELFDRFVTPHFRRLIGLGHDYGLKVMLHCCGGFAPLMPSLIGAGLDAIQAVQPSCKGMDLRELKQNFGRQLLFSGAIDSQHVLIEGTVDHVRRQTKAVLDIMMPGGGYVGGASHDYILLETPLENVLAMFDEIYESGRYS